MTQSPPPDTDATATTSANWVVPSTRRPRARVWRLARFIFLASLSAGFVMTWGLLSEVEARVEHYESAKLQRLERRLERLEEVPLVRALGPHWVVSYRDARGVHTQLCLPAQGPDAQGHVHLYCPQAEK